LLQKFLSYGRQPEERTSLFQSAAVATAFLAVNEFQFNLMAAMFFKHIANITTM